MKKQHFLLVITVVAFIFSLSALILWQEILAARQEKYQKIIQKWRADKNHFFKKMSGSPLLNNQKTNFDSLSYYSINENFVTKAQLLPCSDTGLVQLVATDGKIASFRCYGVAKFSLNEQYFQLLVFQSLQTKDKNRLFIPFLDATNGETTYIGGRYLDVNLSENSNEILLDFNLAYNPFCAYNEDYSCPIPPQENILATRIEAGEKIEENKYYSQN